jgi:hypothetical protein
MDIIQSIQNSAEGWKMIFADAFGGASEVSAQKTELGTALIGSGFSVAQQRYVGIKAGGVSVVSAEAQAPVGVRYMTSSPAMRGGPVVEQPPPGYQWAPGYGPGDPGTPASVIETIQKGISNSAEGWRMGFASVLGKAQTLSGNISDRMLKTQRGVEKSVVGVGKGFGDAAGGVGKWFGNLGEGASSLKWLLYIVVFVLIFVAVMTSIGYSGVGGPAARVAEREYVKRR